MFGENVNLVSNGMLVDIILTAICLLFAVFMVWSRKPLVVAISMLGVTICFSGIYTRLGFMFFGMIQLYVNVLSILIVLLTIYVLHGGVVPDKSRLHDGHISILGIILIIILLAIFVLSIFFNIDSLLANARPLMSLSELGHKVFVNYIVPFELLMFLLFGAAISILLIMKNRMEVSRDRIK